LRDFARNTQGDAGDLFVEDIYDALRAIVWHLKGPKKVGPKLWPTKDEDRAANDLRDCLNRDNARKFEPEEIIALFRMGREADFHRAKHWLDRATGYRESEPLDPALERDRLADVIENATQTLTEALKLAKELPPAPGTIRAVK
jgi:hypothetical protein